MKTDNLSTAESFLEMMKGSSEMVDIDDLTWVDEILIGLDQDGKLNWMEWGR